MIGEFFSWYFGALVDFWGTALRLGLPQIVLLILILMWLRGKRCGKCDDKSDGKSCCWTWGGRRGRWGRWGRWGCSCCRTQCGCKCGQCCCNSGTCDMGADVEAEAEVEIEVEAEVVQEAEVADEAEVVAEADDS